MTYQQVFVIGLVLAGLLSSVDAVRALRRTVRQRRDQRLLDVTGVTASGRVVAVEPMKRELNKGKGHPVTVAFTDARGLARRHRDTSGLGGYLVRDGASVTVRYAPQRGDLARVDAIAGRHGSYPVHPDGRPRPPSLTGRWFQLAGSALAVPAFGLLALADEETIESRLSVVMPVLLGLAGVGFLAGGLAMLTSSRRKRNRRRQVHQDDAVAMVTEVWRETVGSGKNRRVIHPYTVHFVARDGREVHTRTPTPRARNREPQPYERLHVRYDVPHPPRFSIVGESTDAGSVVTGVIFVALAPMLVFVGIMLAFEIW